MAIPFKGNLRIILFIVVPVLILSFFAAYWFFKYFHPSYSNDVPDQKMSVLFVDKEYPELKDLGKSFLTLLIGIFVASITFSEKIVNNQTATPLSKGLLFICWIFFLLSILCTGMGLAFLFGIFTQELYDYILDETLYSLVAYLYGGAGVLFGFGLSCMLVAGAISYFRPTASNI